MRDVRIEYDYSCWGRAHMRGKGVRLPLALWVLGEFRELLEEDIDLPIVAISERDH